MNWFFASGDAPFFFSEQLQTLSIFPDAWHGQEGFGYSALPMLWIDYPFKLITFLLFQLGFSWFWIDKFWWMLVFFLCIVGAYRLTKSWIGSFVYSINTYILLLFDGGQLGVALAYGFFPFVVLSIMKYVSLDSSLRSAILLALHLGTLMILDLRFAYIAFVFFALFFLYSVKEKRIRSSLTIFVIPFIVIGLNSFWILPNILARESLQSSTLYESKKSDLSFFSVADVPKALSLLHPNYPDNMFGRVYFFKPEFLLIPILAYSAFFFSRSWYATFFGLLGFLGAFLSKGTREPFGTFYEVLFNYFPGFFLFRDPTKWYVLIALSYAVLIPYFFRRISKNKIGIGFFLLFWLFSLRYVFLGQVNGNISPPSLTEDAVRFKNLLIHDENFGRVLWLPRRDVFGFHSERHPSVSASVMFSESSVLGILRAFDDPETIPLLRSYGVAYIVIPEDIEQNIFLEDYVFHPELRSQLTEKLDAVLALERKKEFSALAVYTLEHVRDRFRIQGERAHAEMIREDTWHVRIGRREHEGVLHVDMSYDPSWRFIVGEQQLSPFRSDMNFMYFILPQGDEDFGVLMYLPSRWVLVGFVMSLFTMFFSIVLLKVKIRL